MRAPARRRSVNPPDNRYSASEYRPIRGATRTAGPYPPGGPESGRDRPIPDGASTRRFPATSRYPAGTQRRAAARTPGVRSPGVRSPTVRCPGARSPTARCPGAHSPTALFAGARSPGNRSPGNRSLGTRSADVGQPPPPKATPPPPTATPRRLAATTLALLPAPATTLPAPATIRFPPGRSAAAFPSRAPVAPPATPTGRAWAHPAWPRPRTRRGVPGPSSHPSRALSFSLALAVVLAGACVPLRPPPPGDGDVGLIRTGEVDRAGCDIAVTGPLTSGYSPSPTGEGQARSGLGGGPQAAGGPAGRGCAPAVVTIHARTRASSCHLS